MVSGQENHELSRVMEMFSADDARDDAHIESYFVQTEYFRNLRSSTSHVLTGNYGSGKTAFIRQLVLSGSQGKAAPQIIPISLRADTFGEELWIASGKQEYLTFAKALIYLHTLYRLAESAKGTLVTGEKAALIGELRSLNLQPYGDLISRLSSAVGQAVGKVKKLEIASVFGIELQDSEAKPVDMARYRKMCVRIEPLVRDLFAKKKTVFVIDELDAPLRLAKETAALVGVLIRWLKEEERLTGGAMRFLMALPTNLWQVGQDSSDIYLPAQDLFKEIRWRNEELEQLVAARVQKALGPNTAVEEWLETRCSLKFNDIHRLTFQRPRNYIQLMRSCLEVRRANPNRSATSSRDAGLQRYASQTLGWLRAEWQGANEGFADLVGLLQEYDDVVTPAQLKQGINDVREIGPLNKWGENKIISELVKWQLIKQEKDAQRRTRYRPHPIIKLAGQFNS